MSSLTPAQAMKKLLREATSQRVETRFCKELLEEKQGLKTMLHRFDMIYASVEKSNATQA